MDCIAYVDGRALNRMGALAFTEFLRSVHHAAREAFDAASMKGWLGDASLAPPKISFTAQQAITQQIAEDIVNARGLFEGFDIGHEDTTNILWVK